LRLGGLVTDYLLRLAGRVPLKLAALPGGRRGFGGCRRSPQPWAHDYQTPKRFTTIRRAGDGVGLKRFVRSLRVQCGQRGIRLVLIRTCQRPYGITEIQSAPAVLHPYMLYVVELSGYPLLQNIGIGSRTEPCHGLGRKRAWRGGSRRQHDRDKRVTPRVRLRSWIRMHGRQSALYRSAIPIAASVSGCMPPRVRCRSLPQPILIFCRILE